MIRTPRVIGWESTERTPCYCDSAYHPQGHPRLTPRLPVVSPDETDEERLDRQARESVS